MCESEQTDPRFAQIRQIAKALRVKRAPRKEQWERWISKSKSNEKNGGAILMTLLLSDRIKPEYVRRIAQMRFHSRFNSSRHNIELALSRCKSAPQTILDELDVTDWAVCAGLVNNKNTPSPKLEIIARLPERTRPADRFRAADKRDQLAEVRQIAITELIRRGVWEPPAES